MALLAACLRALTPRGETELDFAVRSARHALLGREPSDVASRGAWSRAASRVYHSAAYRYLYLAAGWAAVAVLPAWEAPVVFAPGAQLSAAAAAALRAADVAWLLLVAFDVALQAVYVGRAKAARRGWVAVKVAVLAALAVNLLANAAGGVPYVTRALRPLLLVERMRNVRKLVAEVVRTAPRVLSVGLLLLLNLLLHSILGYALYAGWEDGNCRTRRVRAGSQRALCSTMLYPPQSCSNYFATLSETALHLFELLTAVNFPAVALPVVRCGAVNWLFFISFYCSAIYLLFNLALAVAYAEFYIGMRDETVERVRRTFAGADVAFEALRSIEARGGGSSGGSSGGGGGGAIVVAGASLNAAPAPVAAWGEAAAPASDGGGGGGGVGGALRPRVLSRATFVDFFAALRAGERDAAAARDFGGLLFDAFADAGGALDAPAFRRLLVVAGPLVAKRDPSETEVIDALERQLQLEVEALCTPPRELAGGSGVVAKSNPLAAPGAGAAAAAGGAAAAAATAGSAATAAPSPLSLPASPADERARAPSMGGGRGSPTHGGRTRSRSSSFARSRAQSFSADALFAARRVALLRSQAAAGVRGASAFAARALDSMRRVAEGSALTLVFDALTCVGAAASLTQLALEADDSGGAANPTIAALTTVENATTALCVACLLVRVVAWGPARYWRRSLLNRFDAVSLLVAATESLLTAGGALPPDAVVPVLFFRVLRLARVSTLIPGFASTLGACWVVLPLLGQHVLILLGALYFFAIVGMHAFAGTLVRGPETCAAACAALGTAAPPPCAVKCSAYGVYNYFGLIDFDSLPSALFATFYILGVNDWVVLMEGTVAAVGAGARAYYILFWPVCVLFLFNVVIAFVTVGFGAEKDRRDALHRAAKIVKAGGAAPPPLQTGIVDWRAALDGAPVDGWLVTREPQFNDVYDELYRADIVNAFPETLDAADFDDAVAAYGGEEGKR